MIMGKRGGYGWRREEIGGKRKKSGDGIENCRGRNEDLECRWRCYCYFIECGMGIYM